MAHALSRGYDFSLTEQDAVSAPTSSPEILPPFATFPSWVLFFWGSGCCHLLNRPVLLRLAGPHETLCFNNSSGDATFTVECWLGVEPFWCFTGVQLFQGNPGVAF